MPVLDSLTRELGDLDISQLRKDQRVNGCLGTVRGLPATQVVILHVVGEGTFNRIRPGLNLIQPVRFPLPLLEECPGSGLGLVPREGRRAVRVQNVVRAGLKVGDLVGLLARVPPDDPGAPGIALAVPEVQPFIQGAVIGLLGDLEPLAGFAGS